MKKVLIVLFAFALCFSAFGCSGEKVKKSESVVAAEAAVNGLSEEDKKAFGMSDELTEARSQYDALVNGEKISKVDSLINEIWDVSLDSAAAIDAAMTEYNALSEENKAKVAGKDKLLAAKAKIDELRKAEKEKIISEKTALFDVEEDKVEGITWYTPKAMPQYIDTRSYIIPYIGKNSASQWLGIRYNYTDDDWVFWEKLTIMVDGNKYYKSVGYGDTIRDNEAGNVWEYYDESLPYNADMNHADIVMLKEIANSQETIIRFEGDEYYYDLTVSAGDKNTIKDVLALYEAMNW